MNWKLSIRSRKDHGKPAATLALLIVLPMMMLAAGCGEEPEVDPYTFATLDQVTRGFIKSDDFLYEIEAPEFVFTMGNTGVVRSGGHLEIFVADDLENRAPALSGKLVGVQKFFSPVVWLMAKRVKDGLNIAELDSVAAPVLPHFTDVKLEEVNGFDIGKLAWNKKKEIDEMFDAQVQTVGTFHYLPEHDAEPVEAAADADPDAVVEQPMAWYLRSEDGNATLKVTNVTPSLEFAIRLLESEGLPFVGGVKIGTTYTYKDRQTSRVSAPCEVEYVRYANRFMAP